MFSLVFRRHTEESQTPVAAQVKDDSSSSTDTQSSGCKRQNETVDAGDQQPSNKYQRLELESDDLPGKLPMYTNIYLLTYTQRCKRKKIICNSNAK